MFHPKSKKMEETDNDDDRVEKVYFKESAPKGTYLAVEEAVHGLVVMPGSHRLMKAMGRSILNNNFFSKDSFAVTDFYGDTTILVDSRVLNFVMAGNNNNGTCSQRIENVIYNPVVDRHQFRLLFTNQLQKDVQAGDELLQ